MVVFLPPSSITSGGERARVGDDDDVKSLLTAAVAAAAAGVVDADDDRACVGLGTIEAGVNKPSPAVAFFEEEEATPVPTDVEDDARKLLLLLPIELPILVLAFFRNFCRACRRTNSSTPKRELEY